MSRTYRHRDPEPTIRDPEPEPRKARRYIPASAPTVCPECGASTRMADGRHVDTVHRTILEYRTCMQCGLKVAAGRPMVRNEIEQFCKGFEPAIAEYQDSVASGR
ncbi:MAG: hypothetical protein FJ388_01685 [Verrucomicrobia bacterium]|nr:hypothetical protein [Verrucomicrobiota bacterium]